MNTINEVKNWLSNDEGKKHLNAILSDMKKSKNMANDGNYIKFFFNGLRNLTYFLLIAGTLGAVIVFFATGEIFKSIAIIFILIWTIAFLRYFVWSVYHYNVNYGLTIKDWEKIFDARERQKQGKPVEEAELDAPQYNPYRSQTFGLPPGTVRGMIAFTLLFGAITVLIASMGMDEYDLQNSLIRDQFEFFKTAFLMMIAFYFGDKSLKFLQKRWKDPNTAPQPGTKTVQPKSSSLNSNPNNLVDEDDDEFLEDDAEFEAQESKPNQPNKSHLDNLKSAMAGAVNNNKMNEDDMNKEYQQINDQEYNKILSDEDLKKAISNLKKNDDIIVELPVLKSIIKVESGGRGHLSNGKAKILFEGHKFWYHLKKLGFDPEIYQPENPDILYPKWTKQYYLGGEKEYQRLERAMVINKEAAIYSTSWGLFQIMGENLLDTTKSRMKTDANQNSDFYADLDDFMIKQHSSEYYHLLDFLAFIKSKRVSGKSLIEYVSGHDPQFFNWAKFAYGYNGSGYAQNEYDKKLKNYYQQFSGSTTTQTTVSTSRIPILDTASVDAYFGKPGYTFIGDKQNNLKVELEAISFGIIQKLAKKLSDAKIPFYDISTQNGLGMSDAERVDIADELYSQNKKYYLLSIQGNLSSNSDSGTGNATSGLEVFTSKGTTQSDLLAKIAANAIIEKLGETRFKGIKEENHYVLRQTDSPAIMVKCGYLDNFKEAQYLVSDPGQEELADCLFKIIQNIK